MIEISPYSRLYCNEWKLDPERFDYNIVFDQELFGLMDVDRLTAAFQSLINNLFVFQCNIKEEDDRLYWCARSDIRFKVDYFDKTLTQQAMLYYVKKPFNIHKDLLLKCALINITDKHWRIIIVMHHLIIDGSKVNIFFDHLCNFYNDIDYFLDDSIGSQKLKLKELSCELTNLNNKNKNCNENFWKTKLDEINGVDLSFLKPNTNYSYQSESHDSIFEYSFCYESETLEDLKKLTLQYKVTPYQFSQAMFAVLIYRFSGINRVDFSYPIAIRSGSEIIYGAHINTNIVTYHFSHKMKISEVIEQVIEHFSDVRSNNYHEFLIQDVVAITEKNNALDLSFMQTNMKYKPLNFKDIKSVKINSDLYVEMPGKLSIEQEIILEKLHYRARCKEKYIDKKLLINFIDTYKIIFNEVLTDLLSGRDNALVDYNIISKDQYKWLINDFNNVDQKYYTNKSTHEIFEDQVIKSPNNIALSYNDFSFSYNEINKHANQLARYISVNNKINSGDLIVLYFDGSQQVIIAILAILKLGAAYVPIDSSLPDERTRYMLNDAEAKLVLTNKFCSDKITNLCEKLNLNVIVIDSSEVKDHLVREQANNLSLVVSPNQLAYVIYTSGTTGKPKGVMVEHRNIVNLIQNFRKYPLDLSNGLNVLSTTNYVFDIFTLEYALPLFNGYKIKIVDLINDSEKININLYDFIQITPSKLPLLIDKVDFSIQTSKKHSLTFLLGGEVVNQSAIGSLYLLEKKLNLNKQDVNFTIINVYGPTETTVWSTAAILQKDNEQISIGKALYNEMTYVLDRKRNLLPVGSIGELYIGGAGVSRGYLNQPDLTNANFILNPFQTSYEKKLNLNSRIYKTGDLARFLSNGQLEYIGRNDAQVKIRGHRIELSEIEGALASFIGVQQTAVILYEYSDAVPNNSFNKHSMLIAYYLAEEPLDDTEIMLHLAQYLPDYMLPNMFIHLKTFPLTINGKLDRKSLPDPEYNRINQWIPPHNIHEQYICEAFSIVLSIKKISIKDDFFLLGGNSIKVIALMSLLKNNLEITVSDIFKYRTPENIAKNSTFNNNILNDNLSFSLEKIKKLYRDITTPIPSCKEIVKDHVDNFSFNRANSKTKLIKNVLLTGSTGFLGCNLLNQLLLTTDYNVYLLIRAKNSEKAWTRIEEKFFYYFDVNLMSSYHSRIVVFAADIEKPDLGISKSNYETLINNVDSIIHAAALTKHYGNYNDFYSANVQATINLLNLAELTPLKDFHYISTYSVLNHYSKMSDEIFHEDSLLHPVDKQPNVYIKTKQAAEIEALHFRSKGVAVNIFRVGNLAFIGSNQRAQQNTEDNAFLSRINSLLTMQTMAKEIGFEEISPVDATAQAIIALFDKQELNNGIYHVFNPHSCNIADYLLKNKDFSFRMLPIDEFVDNIIVDLAKHERRQVIERFLLHQGWLEGECKTLTKVAIRQEKTNAILQSLGFSWSPISFEIFNAYIKNARLNNMD